MSVALLFVLSTSVAALAFAGWAHARVLGIAVPDELRDLATALQRLLSVYIGRHTAALGLLGGVLFLALLAFVGVLTAIGFLIGVLSSAAAFLVIIHGGLRLAIQTGGTEEHRQRLHQASQSGRVQGAASLGLGLLGLAGFYVILVLMTPTGKAVELHPLLGFGLGVTLVTLCARLGGELLARSALRARRELRQSGDMADDLRNPAAVIESLGDNAGTHGGLILELFAGFMLSLIGAVLLGDVLLGPSPLARHYPLMVAGFSLLAFLASEISVRRPTGLASADEFFRTLFGAIGLAVIGFYALSVVFERSVPTTGNSPIDHGGLLFAAAIIGLGFAVLVLLSGLVVERLRRQGRLREPASATQRLVGHSLLVLALCAGLWGAYSLAGNYTLAVAVLAMHTLSGPLMVLGAYATLSLNANRLAALIGHPAPPSDEDFARLERLILVTVRSFALISSALAALLLFLVLVRFVEKSQGPLSLELTDMRVVAGLLLGGLLPYLFCALNRNTVGRNAVRLQQEVKRRLAQHPPIARGETLTQLVRPADRLARRSLMALGGPVLLPVAVTALVGWGLGARGLTAAVGGAIISSLLVTVVLREATRSEAARRREDPKPTVFFEGYALGPGIGPVLAAVCLIALLLVPWLD